MASLDEISDRIALDEDPEIKNRRCTLFSSICKPHHTVFLGNYDVNVLMVALEEKGKNLVWHDHRDGVSSIDLNAPNGNLMGIVLNIVVTSRSVTSCFGRRKGRHWVALREIDGDWYNLDSILALPKRFRDTDEVYNLLDYVNDHDGQILLVMNEQQP